MVKYDAKWEIMNTYENLQIVWSQFFTDKLYLFIFGLIQISISLSVFGFIANENKRIAIKLHLTISNIWSAIWWAITKVILNYLPLHSHSYSYQEKGFPNIVNDLLKWRFHDSTINAKWEKLTCGLKAHSHVRFQRPILQ